MASTFALSSIQRRPLAAGRGKPSLLLIAALFIAVLIAEAAVVALALPSIGDITSLYTTTT
jgi:hypothetical protein